MIKMFFKASVVFSLLITNMSYASFGDNPNFAELADRCIDNYKKRDLQYCLSNGFEYFTLETSFDQSNGDEVTFNTDIIKIGGQEIKFEHYNIEVITFNPSSNATSVINNMRLGMETAVLDGGFSTRSIEKNGSSVNGNVTRGSGGRWSKALDNGERAVNLVERAVEIWERFNSDDNRDGFVMMRDANGEPLYFIYAQDGEEWVMVDFTLSENSSGHGGGQVSFTAGFPTSATNGFTDSINNFFENTSSGGSRECRIVFTGDRENMTAQVSCH